MKEGEIISEIHQAATSLGEWVGNELLPSPVLDQLEINKSDYILLTGRRRNLLFCF
jgi:hypothetical protein